jgi:flagellar biosynthesis component FlhA
MSNDMIFATYKLATIAMVEGAVLLWMGMIYGFGIMMAGTIWQQLIALANETEEEDETERRETKASGKADAKAKRNHGKKRLTMGKLERGSRLRRSHNREEQDVRPKKGGVQVTKMDEIIHKAYMSAKSFAGLEPPAGCLYIGSRIANGDRYRYWVAEDGSTYYQESTGEAALKRKRAG